MECLIHVGDRVTYGQSSDYSRFFCRLRVVTFKKSVLFSLLSIHLTDTPPPPTKWPPFRRRNFQMHFHEWNVLCFDLNFNDVCSKGPIDNNSTLVQVMAWHRTGDKPFPEPNQCWSSSLTHICGTRVDDLVLYQLADWTLFWGNYQHQVMATCIVNLVLLFVLWYYLMIVWLYAI